MPQFSYQFTDTQWQLLCQDATAIIVEAAGPDCQFQVTPELPLINGFDLRTGIPFPIQQVAALGGSVWVRSTTGNGAVRAVHDSTTGLPTFVPEYADADYAQS